METVEQETQPLTFEALNRELKPRNSSIEITSLSELSKDKIYHVSIATTDAHPDTLKAFANAARVLDLKLFITMGETKFSSFKDTFENLPQEQKDTLLELLGYQVKINPLDHEQTK